MKHILYMELGNKVLTLCKKMKQIAVDSYDSEEEKLAVKDMTVEKLQDFGLLCKAGRNLYPTHAFDLMTDNRNKAAKIQCALFKGTTRDIFIDRKEFRGAIYEQIDEAFHYMNIVEAWGTGIPRIINRCKE